MLQEDRASPATELCYSTRGGRGVARSRIGAVLNLIRPPSEVSGSWIVRFPARDTDSARMFLVVAKDDHSDRCRTKCCATHQIRGAYVLVERQTA